MAGNINQIKFDYFGSTGIDEAPRWLDHWNVPDQLPQMIRVKLSPADLQNGWPEILIGMQTQAVNGQPQFFQFAGHDQDTR